VEHNVDVSREIVVDDRRVDELDVVAEVVRRAKLTSSPA
jgi:hypothetical protein